MFIGRKKELQSLEELYNKNCFAMSVIYGRRRIGKSTLIAKFIENKKAIFYTAMKVGGKENIFFSLFNLKTLTSGDYIMHYKW